MRSPEGTIWSDSCTEENKNYHTCYYSTANHSLLRKYIGRWILGKEYRFVLYCVSSVTGSKIATYIKAATMRNSTVKVWALLEFQGAYVVCDKIKDIEISLPKKGYCPIIKKLHFNRRECIALICDCLFILSPVVSCFWTGLGRWTRFLELVLRWWRAWLFSSVSFSGHCYSCTVRWQSSRNVRGKEECSSQRNY